MKYYFSILLTAMFLFASCSKKTDESTSGESSTTSEESDWIDLFNGTDFSGWHAYQQETVDPEWTVEDGIVTFTPPAERDLKDIPSIGTRMDCPLDVASMI